MREMREDGPEGGALRHPTAPLPASVRDFLLLMLWTARTGILTALATHYNLKTGDCFPAHGRLAVEAGYRVKKQNS
jgi:hypothetical protein